MALHLWFINCFDAYYGNCYYYNDCHFGGRSHLLYFDYSLDIANGRKKEPEWIIKLKNKLKSNQKILKIGGAVALLVLLLYVILPDKDDLSKEQNIEIVANQDDSKTGKVIDKDSKANEGEMAKASDRPIMVEVKHDAEIYDTKTPEESNQIYRVAKGDNYKVIADAGDYYIIGIEDIYGITNMAYIKKSYVALK